MSSRLFSRREALGVLGVTAVALAADELHFSGLDHVQIAAPDAAKSAAFFVSVFGNPAWKNNRAVRRYVKLGSGYVGIDQGAARVDHFSCGIQGFQVDEVHAFLKQRGVAYMDFPSGRDISVMDPDGIKLELSAENSWAQLASATASPEPSTAAAASGEPIFQASGLDHILLNVSDPEKSAEFYAKIFAPVGGGSVSERRNNRIWFRIGKSRIGLLKTPSGQKTGVNHFCVSAMGFNYDAAIKQLASAGAMIETPEVAGAPEFRDPDGLLVQVNTGA
jgi:catechol 2,3-dioxygenase-like lactoylglutathione lyase family enzyme